MTMNDDDWDLPEDEDQLPPSKTQLKREAQALKDVGLKLVELSAEQLGKLDLPADLLDAVNQAKKIHARSSGRKRQLQYIGKLLRNMDATPVLDGLARLEQLHQTDTREFHEMERWRDRLLEEGDAALTEFMQAYPAVDRQRFRQLVRQARSEKGDQKRNARLLFKEIRSTMEAAQ